MVRVITGKYKSTQLQVPVDVTKPMTDRIKTSIFDLIRDFLPQAKVLDLFAGSGSLGIEALSRGAAEAVFVDDDEKVCELIKANLHKLKPAPTAKVTRRNAEKFLRETEATFDLIFIDPPFPMSAEDKLDCLRFAAPCLDEGGIIVYRLPLDETLPEKIGRNGRQLQLAYQQTYGISQVFFYK